MSLSGITPREIREGPDAIRATVERGTPGVQGAADALRRRRVRRVWVIGNGTSYHSALYTAGLARRLSGPRDPIWLACTAGDFRWFTPRLSPTDAVVGISASGEFRDVVGVFEEVANRVITVGITHVEGSSLARIADHIVLSSGGPSRVPVMTKTFSATLAAVALLCGAVLGDEPRTRVATGLLEAADDAEQAIVDTWPIVDDLAAALDDVNHMFVVGGGLAYPAALEAALKLKEMALVHAEASETWEMASGPATMVGPGTAVLGMTPRGADHGATERMLGYCQAWGAQVIEVGETGIAPASARLPVPSHAGELFAPLVFVPPVAILGYALASQRGLSPDRPSWTERYTQQGLSHLATSD